MKFEIIYFLGKVHEIINELYSLIYRLIIYPYFILPNHERFGVKGSKDN